MIKTLITGLAAVITASSAAQATVYTLTASGNISSHPQLLVDEFDRSGLFGHAGASLAGRPFTAQFRIDTSQLRLDQQTPAGNFYSSGTIAQPPGDGIAAAVRIGTKTVHDIGLQVDPFNYVTGISSGSHLYAYAPYGTQTLFMITSSNPNYQTGPYPINGRTYPGLQLSVNFSINNILHPGTPLFDANGLTPFALHIDPADADNLHGYFSAYSTVTGKFDAFYFDFADIVLSVASGAPEPGSWALLIAGFGLTGAMARRTRGALRTVAA